MSYNEFNPRIENCNLGKMWCWHRRYELGDADRNKYDTQNFSGWSEMKAAIMKNIKPIAILPLYLYDHSGITMSTRPFSCPWDSGQVGFIFFTRENLKDLGYKVACKSAVEKAIACLEAEVRDYDAYLCGDVEEYEEDNG
jgi:hypothetical protein